MKSLSLSFLMLFIGIGHNGLAANESACTLIQNGSVQEQRSQEYMTLAYENLCSGEPDYVTAINSLSKGLILTMDPQDEQFILAVIRAAVVEFEAQVRNQMNFGKRN